MLAVKNGSQVTFSSSCTTIHENYKLDFNKPSNAHSWSSHKSQIGEYIQVSPEVPRYYVGLVLQGGGCYDQWVPSIKVAASMNGYSDEIRGSLR